MVSAVSTTVADSVIDEETAELYDMLVESHEDYATIVSATLTVAVSPAESVALPADLYKLRGVDVQSTAGTWREMAPFEWGDRNDISARSYEMVANNLYVRPSTLAPATVMRLWYVPTYTLFANDAAAFEDRGFAKRIVLSAAIRFRRMEEADVTELTSALRDMDARIVRMARKRDLAHPRRARDVRKDRWYYARRNPDDSLG